MATFYAVATGGWNTPGTWSSTSGGAPNSSGFPGAGDTCYLNAASGNITVSAASTCSCLTLDCTGFTGTLLIPASCTLTIAGATLKFVSTMTYTLGSTTTSQIYFSSASGGTVAWTSGGKTFGNVTIGVSSGTTVTLQDGNTLSSTSTMTLTTGGLYTNGQACSWGSFAASNSSTRSLTLGASSITITGSSWNINTTTNLTLSRGTSTITFTGSAAGAYFGSLGAALTYNNVVISNPSASAFTLQGTNATFANFTYTGGNFQGNSLTYGGTNLTITGTFTATGYSAGVRAAVLSSATGSVRTITAGAVSLSNVDLADITAAGAAVPWTGAQLGDLGGNTNITVTTARTVYGVVAGNFSATATWASASGGAGGQSPPLPQDTVVLDGNSGAGTYTVDSSYRCGALNCTSFTRTLTYNLVSFYGSVTLGSGMTLTGTGSSNLGLAGRGAYTLTTNGIGIPYYFSVSAYGGTYTLGSSVTATSAAFQLTLGGFNTNNYTVTTAGFTGTSGSSGRSLTLGTSTWYCTAGWNMNGTGVTMSATSSTIVMGVSASGLFGGGSLTYGNVTFSTNSAYTITGTNVFAGTLTVPAACYVIWPAGVTTTVGTLNARGQSNGYQYLAAGGTNAQYIYSPASPALEITGNLTIDVHCALTSLTTQQSLVARWNTTDDYMLRQQGNGQPTFYWTTNGSTAQAATPGATLASAGITVNTPFWLRVSFNATANPYTVTFYTSTNGTVWTQLGNVQSGAAPTSVYAGTDALEIGSSNAGGANQLAGAMYEAKLYNSAIGAGVGVPVFDANFTTKAFGANSFVESSANAATVNITGNQAIVGDGRVEFLSSTNGTQATISQASGNVSCNYLVLQDSKATGGATFYAGDESVNTSDNSGWLFVSAPLSTTASSSLSITDGATRLVAQGRTVGDSFTTASTGSRLQNSTRSAASTVTATSAAARATTGSRTAQDAVSPASTASRATAGNRAASSALTIADDGATRRGSMAAATSDSWSTTSSATRVVRVHKTTGDAVSITSAAARAGHEARSGADAVAVASAATRSAQLGRRGADSVTVASVASRRDTGARAATSSITVTSTATRTRTTARAATTTISVSSQASRRKLGSRAIADGWSSASSASAITGLGRSAASAVSIAGTATRDATFTRVVVDSAPLSSTAQRTSVNARLTTSSVVVADSIARAAFASSRSAAEAVAITGLGWRTMTGARTAGTTFTIADGASEALWQGRAVGDGVSISNGATSATPHTRTAADGWSVSDATIAAHSIARMTADAWQISGGVARAQFMPALSLPTGATLQSTATAAVLTAATTTATVSSDSTAAAVAAYLTDADIALVDLP